MKFIECLNSGKKFRHKSWINTSLYLYVKNSIIYNNYHNPQHSIDRLSDDDWELVPYVEIGSLQHGQSILYSGEIFHKVDVFSICGGKLVGIQDKENKVHIVNSALLVEVYHG